MTIRRDGWTEIGGDGAGFPTTSLSILKGIRERQSPEYREALQKLLADYWKPIYCLIRRAVGRTNEDAKDLTQNFLIEMVLDGTFVEQFMPERGRFRAYLKTAVKNFVRNAAKAAGRQKRGGDAIVLSLQMDGFDMEKLVPAAASLSPDDAFEEAWKQQVLTQAVEAVERKLRSQGREIAFEVFKRHDLNPATPPASYRETAEALGVNADKVKNSLTAARLEFRRAIRAILGIYASDDEEVWSEMRDLFGL